MYGQCSKLTGVLTPRRHQTALDTSAELPFVYPDPTLLLNDTPMFCPPGYAALGFSYDP